MATSNATNQTRFDALKAAVDSSVEATRDQEAAPIPASPEIPKCFDENVNNGEDMKAMSIHLRGSLLKGSANGRDFFGAVPYNQNIRQNTNTGLKTIKVIGNGTSGNYMTEEDFMGTYTHIAAGILTMNGRAGARAHTVKSDGTVAVVTLINNPDTGSTFKEVRVDVGGVDGTDAPIMPIAVFMLNYNVRWVMTGGEPAREEQLPIRGELQALLGSGRLGQTVILNQLLTGGDGIQEAMLANMGVVVTSQTGRPTSNQLG